ncbi:MAG: hypothetical protein ABL876_08395 [Chitinophagaceae bacterium]
MKEQLEKKLLLTITVNKEDVQWVKSGKEILLGNRMFDIKSYELRDGYYTFTGLYDDDETLLLQQLRDSQQKEKKTGNKYLVQLFQLLQTPCESLQPYIISSSPDGMLQYYSDRSRLPSLYSTILTPPPQF